MGGKQLSTTLGRYRLSTGLQSNTKSFTPEELWEATYLGKDLPNRNIST